MNRKNLKFGLYLSLHVICIVSCKEIAEDVQTILNEVPTWHVEFETVLLNMTLNEQCLVQFTLTGVYTVWENEFELRVMPTDSTILTISDVKYAENTTIGLTAWTGSFKVEAEYLGHTHIFMELKRNDSEIERSVEYLDVHILKHDSNWEKVFVLVVSSFIMLLYVSYGAALELKAFKPLFLKQVGPALALFGQFVVMPLTSFLIGYFIFYDQNLLRLGLFFSGTATGGGLSELFTSTLNGNLELSRTVTTISNVAAFTMMPFWIFTLGSLIFSDADIPVPYKNISVLTFSLIIPLSVGIVLQQFFPKSAKALFKVLKYISLPLVCFILAYAFYTNAYLFKLISWRIFIASCGLPWCGYLIGWTMAMLLQQSQKDALTIAIETGLKNNGVAIFLLIAALPQPQADISCVVPMAAALATPLPLLGLYLIKLFFCRSKKDKADETLYREATATEIEQLKANV